MSGRPLTTQGGVKRASQFGHTVDLSGREKGDEIHWEREEKVNEREKEEQEKQKTKNKVKYTKRKEGKKQKKRKGRKIKV